MESSFGEKVQSVHATLRQRFDKLSRVAVAIYDQQTDQLKTFAHSTEGDSPLVRYEVRLSDVPSLRYLVEHQQPRVLDTLDVLHGSPTEHSRKVLAAGYQSSYTEPLLFNSKLFGFLFCDAKEPSYFTGPLRTELAAYAQVLAAIIAVDFFSIQTLGGALTTVREFSRYRDEEIARHQHRMSAYSRLIAKRLAPTCGFSDEEVEFIYLFSELHDIGKIAVPDAILFKPGKLTPEEFEVMKGHPRKGQEMIALMMSTFGLEGIHHTDMLSDIVAHHHERFDGQGYPDGLAGEAIPLAARIVTVADVFDALTSERPYKKGWPFETAFAYLEEHAGSQFDPACVAAALHNKAEFYAIYQQYQDPACSASVAASGAEPG
ncbi:HD-GYP domain-containing protein [Aeromonas australiensis]|uniref:HD-GYP domain-containing protein n=1 Tax=Aeromonas australiensis TaxID=1114880 RepID=UPI001F2FB27E|nr:HD-GYP domain-containing protein [Aeromonas australiensis]MCF3099466.1 HD-GYP domain-containing protein [Aeromonas australiensis]